MCTLGRCELQRASDSNRSFGSDLVFCFQQKKIEVGRQTSVESVETHVKELNNHIQTRLEIAEQNREKEQQRKLEKIKEKVRNFLWCIPFIQTRFPLEIVSFKNQNPF